MKIEDIEVTLEPHTGEQWTPAGWVTVTLPQSHVLVNGVRSGYVGDEPGSHISIIVSSYPPAMVEEIKRQVDKKRGNVSKTISVAKEVKESAAVTAKDVTTLSDLKL
jgi:hypothetical protein